MMVKPVKRPRFWMTKGMKMLPFLSSSWQTSFISGNISAREIYKNIPPASAKIQLAEKWLPARMPNARPT